ncbi:metallophosphoesterase [Myxococcota bacterium]|nr:metallophosphoesterase [Myxococcota bacterium]
MFPKPAGLSLTRFLTLAAVTIFGLLASSLVIAAHFYLLERLVVAPALPQPWQDLAYAMVGLLGIVLLAGPMVERWVARGRARWLAWPAYVWMGVGFLMLVAVGALDALAGLIGWAASATGFQWHVSASTTAIVALLLTTLASAVGLRSGLGPPRDARVEIFVPNWPRKLDGFRIAQISDIHIGVLLDRRFAAALTQRVNDLSADLVAVTGDLVDGSVAELAPEVEPFGALRGRLGVFFVTGNHDHFSGATEVVTLVEGLGLKALRNQRVEIVDGGECFDLIGVDDAHAGWTDSDGGENLDAALEGRDENRPGILLAHDPTTFRRASSRGIDLQLSGHTHGGQIWPFGILVRLFVRYLSGVYRKGRAQLYVSRGSGFWGPPLRLFAPAEVTEIVIRAISETHGDYESVSYPQGPLG